MVTVSTSSEAYHHGNLREALVLEGLRALEGPDGKAPSLRELSRKVGVSPTAVYRHFPDKQALDQALAREGLKMLGSEQAAAAQKAGGGAAGFAETGRAYVRFALAHPVLFRLMFTQGKPVDKDEPVDEARALLIANTRALVSGQGRIRWADGTIDSGGEYFSADLDFAAPFGPVEGASGTLVFTDLLAFETAPSQTFQVRSINPGIEVNDGEITLALRRGFEIGIEGGRWPFMGGTLTLRPTDVRFGEGEVRRFTLVVDGLQASRFIERFELANLSATGTFDGRLPLVFDDSGGRIEGGVLVSRPPGGNLSYVGELTYRDLSTMANLAFNVLKSLDYAQMRINMDGDLTGNIVTRVRTFGVRQGEAAERTRGDDGGRKNAPPQPERKRGKACGRGRRRR